MIFQDVCKQVVDLLLADPWLVTILGGPYVYQLLAPEADKFPRIVVAESDREYVAFADDTPTQERVEIEIALYGTENVLHALAGEVHNLLITNDFHRSDVGEDRYLADSYVYAKNVYYETLVNLEG